MIGLTKRKILNQLVLRNFLKIYVYIYIFLIIKLNRLLHNDYEQKFYINNSIIQILL
jgi:hypothetical protein